jgi:hypothetical protein
MLINVRQTEEVRLNTYRRNSLPACSHSGRSEQADWSGKIRCYQERTPHLAAASPAAFKVAQLLVRPEEFQY